MKKIFLTLLFINFSTLVLATTDVTEHCVKTRTSNFCFMTEVSDDQVYLYTNKNNYDIFRQTDFHHFFNILHDEKDNQPVAKIMWTTNDKNELVYQSCSCDRPFDAKCIAGTIGSAGLGGLSGGWMGPAGVAIGIIYGGMAGAGKFGCFN